MQTRFRIITENRKTMNVFAGKVNRSALHAQILKHRWCMKFPLILLVDHQQSRIVEEMFCFVICKLWPVFKHSIF